MIDRQIRRTEQAIDRIINSDEIGVDDLLADSMVIKDGINELLAEVKRLRELIKEIAQHDAKEYWSYELLQKVEMIE